MKKKKYIKKVLIPLIRKKTKKFNKEADENKKSILLNEIKLLCNIMSDITKTHYNIMMFFDKEILGISFRDKQGVYNNIWEGE